MKPIRGNTANSRVDPKDRIRREGLVIINRDYNLLRIPPLDSEVTSAIYKLCSFTLLRVRPKEDEPRTETISCYRSFDIAGETYTMVGAGIAEELVAMLEGFGYEVYIRDLVKPSEILLKKMEIDMSRVAKVIPNLRGWQEELFRVLPLHRGGQIQSGTGSGKSTAINATIYGLPKARILYASMGRQAVETQYEKVTEYVPDAALLRGSMRGIDSRVVFATTGMLPRIIESRRVFDYFFVDEHHRSCTSHQIGHVLPVRSHRIWAFSAQYHDRLDRADRWSDVAFGPLRVSVKYQENVEEESVVPIEVRWRSTKHIRRMSFASATMRERMGIVRNDDRNRLIVEDAQRHPDDQVLIMVNTIEHGLILRRDLHCPVIYAGLSVDRLEELRDMGLFGRHEKPLKRADIHQFRDLFAAGHLKLAIATSIWNEAVDFKKLAVLVRAEAQASKIKSTQITGRAGRLSEGKSVGIIYDYRDDFEYGLEDKAIHRRNFYAKSGYTQVSFDET